MTTTRPDHGLERRLRQHVDALSATPRPPDSAAHAAAREYVRTHLQTAGFDVNEQANRQVGMNCINLLTAPLPDDPNLPLVIVGAHYDSTPDTPGADDNASAVAALIEIAAWLKPRLVDAGKWATARLQLAAYDLEEYGMIGSYAHARSMTGPVRCMISLEMLGFTDKRPGGQKLPPQLAGLYPDVGDFIGVVGNQASQRWLDIVTAGLKTAEGLPVEAMAVPGTGEMLPPTRLSDHSSFWDAGHPALMVTDTSFFRNPHYHLASDRPQTLDYPFLANVTAGMGAAILRLLAAE
jgi:Zn-dependent M28 family amino/carboxypeptidase